MLACSGIPVLVEAERLRPHLEELLAEADYVSTSAKFPQVCFIILFIFASALYSSPLGQRLHANSHFAENTFEQLQIVRLALWSCKQIMHVQAWTGEASLSQALRAMLQRLPLARWTFTTLGAKGAVMLQRCPKEDVAGTEGVSTLSATLATSFSRAPTRCLSDLNLLPKAS